MTKNILQQNYKKPTTMFQIRFIKATVIASWKHNLIWRQFKRIRAKGLRQTQNEERRRLYNKLYNEIEIIDFSLSLNFFS